MFPIFTLCYQLGSIILAIAGFRILQRQLEKNEQYARSNFILSLNTHAQKFTKLHDKIQQGKDISDLRSRLEARDFLRLLESIMLLVSEGVISAKEVFPSLGYRVFTFMNNEHIQREFLFVNFQVEPDNHLEQACARHAGAFALYNELFRHFAGKFTNVKQALEHYEIKDAKRSIYWRREFKNGVYIYYLHKDPDRAEAKRKQIDDTKATIMDKISKQKDSV